MKAGDIVQYINPKAFEREWKDCFGVVVNITTDDGEEYAKVRLHTVNLSANTIIHRNTSCYSHRFRVIK